MIVCLTSTILIYDAQHRSTLLAQSTMRLKSRGLYPVMVIRLIQMLGNLHEAHNHDTHHGWDVTASMVIHWPLALHSLSVCGPVDKVSIGPIE